uniref:CMP/dCMP-type deaminase domain-containing protein n=1 Tax=Syphacia muris TaxID=451379 RepID=A0A0N5AX27_9BILA
MSDGSTEVFEKITDIDERFMDAAFQQAEEAFQNDEVPVGCVVVINNVQVAVGRNDVNRTKNPTRHAEMVALDNMKLYCSKICKNLSDLVAEATLYVTLEPCIMCAAALYHLRFRRIFYAAANERFGGLDSVGNRRKYGAEHIIDIISCCRPTPSIELLKKFYDKENPFCPEEIRNTKRKGRLVLD